MRSIWKNSAMKTAAILPGVRRVVQLGDQLWGDLRSFVMSTPAKPRHLPARSTSSGTRGVRRSPASKPAAPLSSMTSALNG